MGSFPQGLREKVSNCLEVVPEGQDKPEAERIEDHHIKLCIF